jgi:hypothetical protein
MLFKLRLPALFRRQLGSRGRIGTIEPIIGIGAEKDEVDGESQHGEEDVKSNQSPAWIKY